IPLRSSQLCPRALVALFLSLVAVPCGAQAGKVEPIGPLTETTVPELIRQSLNEKGYRVTPDNASPALEIWYRKQVPAQPKTASADAVYERVVPWSLVGVLHFTKGSTDFRGQAIAAGFYTLRAALMPDDGNHLGVAPSRDFLLLVPPAADPGPDATPKFLDLVALSRQASGTKHPAPMSLVPAEGGVAPGVTKDEEGHAIFIAPVRLSSGEDIPLALIVKGTASQ
ncbi:MAG TPA: hypothetical protein VKE24_16960, partial [Candidatus Acidoferrales bacterium]|nr:hypothetical protein [Candidatus Acidoferrales bacterium]